MQNSLNSFFKKCTQKSIKEPPDPGTFDDNHVDDYFPDFFPQRPIKSSQKSLEIPNSINKKISLTSQPKHSSIKALCMNVQGLNKVSFQNYLQLAIFSKYKPDLLMFNETHLKNEAVFPSFN